MSFMNWVKGKKAVAQDASLTELKKSLAEHKKYCTAKERQCPYEAKLNKVMEKMKDTDEADDLDVYDVREELRETEDRERELEDRIEKGMNEIADKYFSEFKTNEHEETFMKVYSSPTDPKIEVDAFYWKFTLGKNDDDGGIGLEVKSNAYSTESVERLGKILGIWAKNKEEIVKIWESLPFKECQDVSDKKECLWDANESYQKEVSRREDEEIAAEEAAMAAKNR